MNNISMSNWSHFPLPETLDLVFATIILLVGAMMFGSFVGSAIKGCRR